MTAIPDLEAEQAVLGSVLLSPAAVLPVLLVDEHLTASDFSEGRHADIWQAMADLHDAGQAIDPLTVSRKTGLAKADVDWFATAVPAPGNARHYAQMIRRAALRRRWHHAGMTLLTAAEEDDLTLAEQAERELAHGEQSSDTYDQDRLAAEINDYFDQSKPIGITTGFQALDEILAGGFRPGNMSVLAAWEAMGKSVLVSQWLALAADQGLKAHLYTNDTPVRDLALRMIAHMGAARWEQLAARRMPTDTADRVLKASSQLPFAMTDTSDYETWTARALARHIRVNQWDLCALDVLHNMPYRDEGDLRLIASTLKNAAQSVGTHLILVCHLNQERARDEILPAPVMRDLRGSGMLGKLAANVLFLHRPQVKDGDVSVITERVGMLVAAKARNGKQGEGIEVAFEPRHMRFRLPTYEDRGMAA